MYQAIFYCILPPHYTSNYPYKTYSTVSSAGGWDPHLALLVRTRDRGISVI